MELGQVEAEVRRFHDGRWWERSFAVQPGDQIGGVRSIATSDAGADEDSGSSGKPSGGEDEEGAGEQDSDAAGKSLIDFSTGYYVLVLVPDLDLDPAQVRFGREAGVYLGPVNQDAIDQSLHFHHP